ncbi:MAG: peptidyl-prolyl cis-trans isomerase, EpsD family [Aquincola sp.]|nr:peptidyl-prolyl cis-trans isomerase, EpsD family [Aquincola sp.]
MHRCPFVLASCRAQRVLLIGCLALLAACGGETKSDASQVVARVNEQEISIHQVNQILRRQAGLKPEQMDQASREVAERLVEQEIAVQRALKLKLDQDPLVMQEIGAARREVLARAYAQRLADSAAKPSAEDVRKYFDANPGFFAQRRVFLLQDLQVQGDAAQIDRLRERVTTAKSLREISDHLRRDNLPVKASQITEGPESLPPALATRLVTLRDGQAVMMPSPGGSRIVVIAGSRPSPISLEQATPYITQLLEVERRRKAVEEGVVAMRKESEIQFIGRFSQGASAPADKPTPADALAPTSAPLTDAASAPATAASGVDSSTMSRGLQGLR